MGLNAPSPGSCVRPYWEERWICWKEKHHVERPQQAERLTNKSGIRFNRGKSEILHLGLKQQDNKPKSDSLIRLQISRNGQTVEVLCKPIAWQWAEHEPATTAPWSKPLQRQPAGQRMWLSHSTLYLPGHTTNTVPVFDTPVLKCWDLDAGTEVFNTRAIS